MDDEGRGHGDDLRREFPAVEILRTETPVYWTGAIRLGVEHALATGARSVLFFNQDVTVPPGYFQRLSETTERFPGVRDRLRRGLRAEGRRRLVGRGANGVVRPGLPGPSPRGLRRRASGGALSRGLAVRDGNVRSRRRLREDRTSRRRSIPDGVGRRGLHAASPGRGNSDPRRPGLRLSHEVGRYDARVAPAPTFVEYVSWLKSPIHNISLSAQREVWRRHGPGGCGACPSPCDSCSCSSTSSASGSSTPRPDEAVSPVLASPNTMRPSSLPAWPGAPGHAPAALVPVLPGSRRWLSSLLSRRAGRLHRRRRLQRPNRASFGPTASSSPPPEANGPPRTSR